MNGNQAGQPSHSPSAELVLVVGIGASAGGLEAISELLRHLPTDSGMAYVLIQHLSADQPSLMSEILSRTTLILVTEVEDGVAIEPNHIYSIPSNTQMTIEAGHLRLMSRDRTQPKFMPIDTFFRSLATTYGNQAVGVVLSGLDGDGAQGIREIKGNGGITFAQCEASAQYSSMPHMAAATGKVDFILPPAEIAAKLADISRHPYLERPNSDPPDLPSEGPQQENEAALSIIFSLLRTTTGTDFRHYKQTTFERRLHRRMALHKLHSLADYAQYLQENAAEVQALYQDELIAVTSFFRDPEVFASLKETVFPALLQSKTPDSSIRIWVPGCATGEECYSLAICLLAFLENCPVKPSIQIFGTDINEAVIDKARTGIYAESISADIPLEYRRFFTSSMGHYQVSKMVRERCIFARQNLIGDPPFSNVDLISCRNVLIYLTRSLQQRVFSVFHYSLNANGFLMLGSSESVGDTSTLFTTVDKQHRFYHREAGPGRLSFDSETENYRSPTTLHFPTQLPEEMPSRLTLQHLTDQVILSRHSPAGFVVNEALDILQFRGDTSPYLRPMAGTPSLNLNKMLQPSLLRETRLALVEVKEQDVSLKRTGLPLAEDLRRVSLEVLPLKHPQLQESCYLILFTPEAPTRPEPTPTLEYEQDPSVLAIEPSVLAIELAQARREQAQACQELQDNQLYLQTIIEEQESTHQRLVVANEEILSSNEELQSTNEELQTAKEEVQAANEELKTTNEELLSRNQEARQVNDDLVNLLTNANLPILILSSDLCIRRFTPSAQQVFNLIPTDEGRPLNNIRLNLDFDVCELEQLILEVMETLKTQEQEIQDTEGRWYILKIRPYRTVDNRIDGAVLVLVDINDTKQAQRQLEAACNYAENIIETVQHPLLVLNADLQVLTVNRAFYERFQVSPHETQQYSIFELGNGQWNIPPLRSLLEELLPQNTEIENFEIEYEFEQIGQRTVLLNAREIDLTKEDRLILLAIEDITERKQVEAERLQSVQNQVELAEAANVSKDDFLSMLSHELRTPLNSILGWLQILLHHQSDPILLGRGLNTIEHSAQAQARLINELLDTSRIIQNRLELELSAVDLTQLTRAVIEVMLPLAESKSVYLQANLAESPGYFLLDPNRIEQVVWNLISNAIKFTPEGGQINLLLTYQSGQARIQVTDTGEGISPEFLPQVFDRFQQGSHSTTRQYGGLGLGLAIAKYLVDAHDGAIIARSPGAGLGATFTVTLPLIAIDAPPEELDIQEQESILSLAGFRLLIVDDDPDNIEVLEIFLSGIHSADVTTAKTVNEAMARFAEQPPDLLITDISMPNHDGFELIKRVRTLSPEQGGDVPAIAVTGHAAESDAQQLLAAGFQAHIPKPIQFDELISAIMMALS